MESFFASAEGVRIAIQRAANEPICPHRLNGVKSGIRSQPRKPQGAVTRVAHLGVFWALTPLYVKTLVQAEESCSQSS